jgi:hypothetical protein
MGLITQDQAATNVYGQTAGDDSSDDSSDDENR